VCHPAIEILELHGVGHAAKPLEGFADRAHIGEVDIDADLFAGLKAFIAAEFEQ
jgi:hypothetical protein